MGDKRKTISVGSVKLGKKIIVSDPMYRLDTDCAVIIERMKKGEYAAEVVVADCGEWGKRVAALRVYHKDYKDVLPEFLAGNAGVDSALLGVWDYDGFAKVKQDEVSDEAFFNRLMGIDQYSVEKFGVVSSTGFGDGGYPVYIGHADGGEVVAIEIEFTAEGEE